MLFRFGLQTALEKFLIFIIKEKAFRIMNHHWNKEKTLILATLKKIKRFDIYMQILYYKFLHLQNKI